MAPEENPWLEGMSTVNNGRRKNNNRERQQQQRKQQQRIDIGRAKSIPLHKFEIVNELETFFAVACFLNDLSDIRAFVKAVWQEYANGTAAEEEQDRRAMGLSTAALLTNVALQTVARMENEFYIMFPKLSNFEDILKELDPVCASLYVQRNTGPQRAHAVDAGLPLPHHEAIQRHYGSRAYAYAQTRPP